MSESQQGPENCDVISRKRYLPCQYFFFVSQKIVSTEVSHSNYYPFYMRGRVGRSNDSRP